MTEETEKITTEDINQALQSSNQSKENSSNTPRKPILRTMKSDMQEYINRQKMSIIDIAGKQAKKQGLKISSPYTNWANKLITIAVIILVISSVGIFGYTAVKKKNSQTTKKTTEKNLPAPIVSTDEQRTIILSGNNQEDNKKIIEEALHSNIALGNLVNFIFTDENKNILTADQFFKYLSVDSPLGFSSFLSDKFMFGVYSLDINEPFIILKIRSYENVFALMLKWEKTMKNDLRVIVSDNGIPPYSAFQDKIIKNHDTRILYGQNGQINILYSFLDKETLIITPGIDTFEEVLRRLSSSRI